MTTRLERFLRQYGFKTVTLTVQRAMLDPGNERLISELDQMLTELEKVFQAEIDVLTITKVVVRQPMTNKEAERSS